MANSFSSFLPLFFASLKLKLRITNPKKEMHRGKMRQETQRELFFHGKNNSLCVSCLIFPLCISFFGLVIRNLSFKLAKKRGKKEEKLFAIVQMLQTGEVLPAK